MVRGRATGRGSRRGAAAASQRSQTEGSDATVEASETPAPTTEGTEAASAATDGAARASVRRGATARATRAPSAARFRPRNIRRDEAERDNMARQEEAKATERAAEERRARGRSRFRSKRSRGDTMGSRGGFGRVITGASGPFSSGLGSSSGPSRSSGWFGGTGSGGGSGSASGLTGGGSSGKSTRSGKGTSFNDTESGYIHEPRINADKLNAQTPSNELGPEDEATVDALNSRGTKIFPMGIYRREHKETGVVVATTAELEAAENATGEEESLWVDGQDPSSLPLDMQPEEQGIWETEQPAKLKVKKEPGTDDPMSLDTNTSNPLEDEEEEKLAGKIKVKKVLPQDPEEKMIQSDLNLLANELGAVTITENGETRTDEPANKDGRMYLFQFPPLLPPLKPSTPRPSKIKEEPQDVDMFDASAADPTPVDLTQEEAQNDLMEGEEDPQDKNGFMSSLLSQGGMIGKLNVRKSGRVELDWGGRILEMSPATGMNFMTTAVIVEESDEKPQHDVVGGDSIGMGKIMGRFVLAPTWSEEEEWNVSPEDLGAA